MRIVGGEFRGRRFTPPADHWPTRPTTDLAKEALYNILENRIDFSEVSMLDLFGGTGSHTYEVISRGCRHCTYVDRFYPCVQYVKEVLIELGVEDYVTVHKMNVRSFLKIAPASPFDYIFAGPPYGLPWLDEIPDMVLENAFLVEGGYFVLEHNAHHDFAEHTRFTEERRYGGTHFSFFQ